MEDTAALIESASRGDQRALSGLVSQPKPTDSSVVSYPYNQLHRREGNRCCITGAINAKDPGSIPSFVEEADLEVAHILPFALNNFNELDQKGTVRLERSA